MWFGRYSHKWASGQPTLCDSLYEIRKVLEFTGHSLLITKADLEVAISDTKIVDHSLYGCFILQGHGIGKVQKRFPIMGISFRSFFAIIRRLFDEGAIVWFNESLTFKERFKKDQ